jgi:hypothetical protein
MLRVDPAESSSRTVDEQFTQIAIAAFADPEEPWLAFRRVFAWDQSQSGRKPAAVLDLGRVADRRNDGGGADWPNPGDGLQPLTFRMGSTNGRKLLVVIRQSLLEG